MEGASVEMPGLEQPQEDFSDLGGAAPDESPQEETDTDLQSRLKTNLLELRAAVKQSSDHGIDIDDAQELVNNALIDFQEGRFKDALVNAIAAKKEVNKGRAKKKGKMIYEKEDAIEAIQEARSAISKAKMDNRQISAAEQRFSEARGPFNEGDYETAIKLSSEAVELAENAELMEEDTSFGLETAGDPKKEEALAKITEFRQFIGELKSKGADTSHAETIFKEAKPSFDIGDYDDVISTVDRAMEAAQSAQVSAPADDLSPDDAKEEALTKIKEARTTLKQLKAQGKDTSEAEEIFKGAKPSFELNDYKSVIEIVDRALEAAENVPDKPQEPEEEETDFSLGGSSEDMEENYSMDDEEDSGPQWESTTSRDDLGETTEGPSWQSSAEETVAATTTTTTVATSDGPETGEPVPSYDEVLESLKSTRELIIKVKEFGMDTSSIEEMFKEAKPLLDADDFQGALKVSNDCKEEIIRLQTGG